jgi:hypothetical protein
MVFFGFLFIMNRIVAQAKLHAQENNEKHMLPCSKFKIGLRRRISFVGGMMLLKHGKHGFRI